MGNFWYTDKPCGPGMHASEFSVTDRPATAPVYLVKLHQHTPGESCSEDLKEHRAHWVVVVDIDRKSDVTNIKGLELHLMREAPESNTLVLGPLKAGTFDKARLQEEKHIGDIHNLGGLSTHDWAYSLHSYASKTFNTLAVKEGDQWSANMNCQQYARKLLQDLGLPFNEEACGDSHTALIDCYCTLDMWMHNCK